MKDDKLERFIKNNRSELDDEFSGEDLWAGIEKELSSKKPLKSMKQPLVYWRAAAVLLLLVTSWLVYEKISHGFQDDAMQEMAMENREFMEVEAFYTNVIQTKKLEIDQRGDHSGLGLEFKNEIDVLDSMYVVLKNEMKFGNIDEMKDAMVLNLQIRVEILNQQIKILEALEKSKKDENISL